MILTKVRKHTKNGWLFATPASQAIGKLFKMKEINQHRKKPAKACAQKWKSAEQQEIAGNRSNNIGRRRLCCRATNNLVVFKCKLIVWKAVKCRVSKWLREREGVRKQAMANENGQTQTDKQCASNTTVLCKCEYFSTHTSSSPLFALTIVTHYAYSHINKLHFFLSFSFFYYS